MTTHTKMRLGELLVEHHIITEKQLTTALSKRQTEKGKIGNILLELGYIDENTLYTFLAKQSNIPFLDLKCFPLNIELALQLPETIARRLQAIVLQKQEGIFLVGTADPQNTNILHELSSFLQAPIKLALVNEKVLLDYFKILYRHSNNNNTDNIKQFFKNIPPSTNVSALPDITPVVINNSIPQLAQTFLENAIQMRVSEIHLEPSETGLRIRQRINDVLQENTLTDTNLTPALIKHLKQLASLKCDQQQLPQDGHFNVKIKNKDIQVRLSILPVQQGESIVLYLLENSADNLQLQQLGMSSSVLNSLHKIMRLSQGIFLISGPTVSGKTSTLYSILNEQDNKEKKIITIEDSVKHSLPHINQVQINPDTGLTFAHILPTVLRQNPDIIMIDEIDEIKIASLALYAVLENHLVLAALHTADGRNSIQYLVEAGGKNSMLLTNLRGLISQRLLRRICENCAQTYHPTSQDKAWIDTVVKNAQSMFNEPSFSHGIGCQQCNNTGYRGHIGVYELVEFDEDILTTLSINDSNRFATVVQSKGLQTLAQAALTTAAQGLTTLQEARIRI